MEILISLTLALLVAFCLNTPLMADLTEFIILETNTVVESYDVTFDETAPCPHDIFECAVDKEMKENIFVDEGL
jgi:hypothetical protein